MMRRKVVAVLVSHILLLSLITIIGNIVPPVRGATITVDDDGPADYSTIQEAVDAANPGDTVFVYNGTYNENVLITKMMNLTGEDKNNTYIDAGGIGDTLRIESNWVNVTGFNISGCGTSSLNGGIRLESAQNCSIFNNSFWNNNNDGIFGRFSDRNWIYNNMFSSYKNAGISLEYSDYNNIISNTIIANTSFGGSQGIELDFSQWNNVADNFVSSNSQDGMFIHWFSDNCNISNNHIIDSYSGIRVGSDKLKIVSNNISFNEIGIELLGDGVNITSNEMHENGIYMRGGWTTNFIDLSNTVNGKPVLYLKNQTSGLISSDYGQIILGNCSNVTIENIEFDKCTIGIQMGYCDNINITNITVSNSWYGIYVFFSPNINLSYNYLINNYYGVFIRYSDSNNIYYNNISDSQSRSIYFDSSSKNTIIGNNISNNRDGLMFYTSSENNIISNNKIRSSGNGIYFSSSGNNNVTQNNLSENWMAVGSGYSNWINVTNNTIFNNAWGISITYSDFSNIINNNVTNSIQGGIKIDHANDNMVKNNNFLFSDFWAIEMLHSSRNSIINNNCSSIHGQALDILESTNNDIIKNIFYTDSKWNSYIDNSDNNNYTHNYLQGSSYDSDYGIYNLNSNGNNFSHNEIYNDFGYGIKLISSNDAIISFNNVSNNQRSIDIEDSSNAILYKNRVWDNEDGISIGPSSNTKIIENIIYSQIFNGLEIGSSNNMTVEENTIFSNGFSGILLSSSSNSTIINNDVLFNDMVGIVLGNWIELSKNNLIMHNNITGNYDGIRVSDSYSTNKITKNNITSNTRFGIILWDASEVFIKENTFIDDGIGIWGDQLSYYNTHEIFDDNLVNGKPLYYYKNINDIVIDSIPVGEIILANCSNFSIKNNEVNNSDAGIFLAFSYNNIITNNYVFSQDYYGIYVAYSNSNDVISNNVSANYYGILLRYSSNTSVYHNNIINNTYQADCYTFDNFWDNGYPSGGNYWSDYGGLDNFKGPLQDIPGKDGIGDTNYTVYLDAKDNYPLMGPYPDRFLFLDYGWNLISIPTIQSNMAILSVLASLQGQFDAVQFYNNTDGNDHWKHYHISKPSQLNDLMENNHKQGFWIHITNPSGSIFRYDGVEPSTNQTIDIKVGWNMVGYPSLSIYNRTDGLNNLQFGPEIDAIQWFDSSTKTWHFLEEGDHFVPGRGYWFHSKVDTTWEVPL